MTSIICFNFYAVFAIVSKAAYSPCIPIYMYYRLAIKSIMMESCLPASYFRLFCDLERMILTSACIRCLLYCQESEPLMQVVTCACMKDILLTIVSFNA